MTDLENLKPCPFCGGEAELWRHSTTGHLNRPAWVACMGRCSVLVSREYGSDAEAITAWNTRASDAALLVAERALRDAQSTLADLTNPDEPSGSQIVAMYARCRSAEFSARAALSEIEKLTGGGE